MINENVLAIPRRELAILEALIRRAGRVVQRDNLEASVYNIGDELESNALILYVSRLRKRLREANCNITIQTIRGIGYMLAHEQ